MAVFSIHRASYFNFDPLDLSKLLGLRHGPFSSFAPWMPCSQKTEGCGHFALGEKEVNAEGRIRKATDLG